MKYKKEVIIYNNEICNAIDKLEELGINPSEYYKRRNKGVLPQLAFDRSVAAFELRDSNLTGKCREHHISSATMYKGFRNNKDVFQIIDEKMERLYDEAIFLDRLYDDGMPKIYNNLSEFCEEENLDYIRIYQKLKKGMNLKEAIIASMVPSNKSSIYNISKIQIKSFCQKYKLDSCELTKQLKENNDYKACLYRRIFNQSFNYNIGRKANKLWELFNNDFENDSLSEEEKLSFALAKTRIEIIKRHLEYYEFLSNFNILEILKSNIDEVVNSILIDNNHFLPFSLTELYYIFDFKEGLMKDFSYNEDGDFWYYSPRNVLLSLTK